jgi:hypothetical protein
MILATMLLALLVGMAPMARADSSSDAIAVGDNACAILTAYIRFGMRASTYEMFFDKCSEDPNGTTCMNAKTEIQNMPRAKTLDTTETLAQIAAHLHCRQASRSDGPPVSTVDTATGDNACAMLTAYIQFGMARSIYEPFFDKCSRNPDATSCEATKEMISKMPRAGTLDTPETQEQLAAHLHCGN